MDNKDVVAHMEGVVASIRSKVYGARFFVDAQDLLDIMLIEVLLMTSVHIFLHEIVMRNTITVQVLYRGHKSLREVLD